MWDYINGPYCYLSGGPNGKECQGAVKSGYGDFYWTRDDDICGAAEKYRKSSKLFDIVVKYSGT